MSLQISMSSDIGLQLSNLKAKIEESFKETLAEYTRDFVTDLVDFTPIGNPEDRPRNSRYYRYYYWRMIREGHQIKGGLAKGNWRVVFRSGATGIVQRYVDDADLPASLAYDRIMQEYKMGRPFYIVNNVKYINKLNAGLSSQTYPGYIEQIMQIYRDLSRYNTEFARAVNRGTS